MHNATAAGRSCWLTRECLAVWSAELSTCRAYAALATAWRLHLPSRDGGTCHCTDAFKHAIGHPACCNDGHSMVSSCRFEPCVLHVIPDVCCLQYARLGPVRQPGCSHTAPPHLQQVRRHSPYDLIIALGVKTPAT